MATMISMAVYFYMNLITCKTNYIFTVSHDIRRIVMTPGMSTTPAVPLRVQARCLALF